MVTWKILAEKKNDDLQGYAKRSKTQTALRPEKVNTVNAEKERKKDKDKHQK